MNGDYKSLMAGIIEDYLNRFPDASSLMLARMIYRDHSAVFLSVEQIRGSIRYRRGAQGEDKFGKLKDKRYGKYRKIQLA